MRCFRHTQRGRRAEGSPAEGCASQACHRAALTAWADSMIWRCSVSSAKRLSSSAAMMRQYLHHNVHIGNDRCCLHKQQASPPPAHGFDRLLSA